MKKKKNFIIAIIFSIGFPILFGIVYLNYFNESNKIASLDLNSKPEIIYDDDYLIGDPELVVIEDNNYKSADNYSFFLAYNNKDNQVISYNIYLNGKFSENADVLQCLNWKLEKYDYDLKIYRLVNSGNFKNFQNERILLTNQENINNNELQKYKLYYYFISNTCLQEIKNTNLNMTIKID